MIILRDPVTHGALIAGKQGIGVSTPPARIVAVATIGFKGLEHIPNEDKFGILKSVIVAIEPVAPIEGLGITIRGRGISPNEQAHTADIPVLSIFCPV